MKATDLRIGNCLQDRNGKLAIVEGLCEEDGIRAFSGMVTGLPLQPIPLTEEWLLKFGFERIGKNFDLKGFYLIWNVKDKEFDFIINNKGIGIKHVHQLQNLYHALTGEEL